MRESWNGRVVMISALAIDLALGDPPSRRHPVAWMGSAIAAAERRLPHKGPASALASGAVLSLIGVAACAGLGHLLERTFALLPYGCRELATAAVLKTTLSARGLAGAASEVEEALVDGELDRARGLLAWHLVSRDTESLDESRVAAATVESMAENTGDGIIAPMAYYAAFGLPGALAYRFINTADAMLGYHDDAHEWFGKVPARLDDLANLVPARFTAAAYLLGAVVTGKDVSTAWAVLRRDRHKTASPNAGYPMSTVAGALGIELEKEGHYRLGAGLRAARPCDIGRAVDLMWAAVAVVAAVLSFAPRVGIGRQKRTGGGVG